MSRVCVFVRIENERRENGREGICVCHSSSQETFCRNLTSASIAGTDSPRLFHGAIHFPAPSLLFLLLRLRPLRHCSASKRMDEQAVRKKKRESEETHRPEILVSVPQVFPPTISCCLPAAVQAAIVFFTSPLNFASHSPSVTWVSCMVKDGKRKLGTSASVQCVRCGEQERRWRGKRSEERKIRGIYTRCTCTCNDGMNERTNIVPNPLLIVEYAACCPAVAENERKKSLIKHTHMVKWVRVQTATRFRTSVL